MVTKFEVGESVRYLRLQGSDQTRSRRQGLECPIVRPDHYDAQRGICRH
jgi:hypothetical protein